MTNSEDIVGRADETSVLERAVLEVAYGSKRALLLLGEPGMGKTTLLHWAGKCAEQSGFICGAVRAPTIGGLTPLFPLPEILNALAESRRNAEGGSVAANALNTGSEDDSHFQPLDVLKVAQTLEETARTSPIAIFIDDLQWAPVDGLAILYSALRLIEIPALLVLTARTGTHGDELQSPLPKTSADLAVEYLPIGGLDTESIESLASRLLMGPVLPSLSRNLHDLTLGNPLFAREILRAWKEQGGVTRIAGGYWGLSRPIAASDSRSLLDMIGGRLRFLGKEALSVGTTLAVLGRGSQPDELREVLGFPFEITVDALAEIEQAGIASREFTTGS
jgi:predicted ATPase